MTLVLLLFFWKVYERIISRGGRGQTESIRRRGVFRMVILAQDHVLDASIEILLLKLTHGTLDDISLRILDFRKILKFSNIWRNLKIVNFRVFKIFGKVALRASGLKRLKFCTYFGISSLYPVAQILPCLTSHPHLL